MTVRKRGATLVIDMKCRKPCVYCDYWEIREHEYVTPDGESHTEEYHVCTKPRDKGDKKNV